MRRFANLYIILFLIDAGLSLADELLARFGSPLSFLTGGRMLVALVVVALSLVLYLCLGVDRRLPKRVLLPMILFVTWSSLAMWPLSGVIDRGTLPLLASVGQVAIGLLAIAWLHGRVLLPQEMFHRSIFSLRNTLGFTAINLLLAPVLALYLSLALASNYLEEHTAGFLRIGPAGIYMAERSYYRGSQEIRLAGMMHIGTKEYYQDLADSISSKSTIILAEGVTDRDGLLKYNFDYGRLAGVIGTSSQDQMQIDAHQVDLNDLAPVPAGDGDKPDIAWADIDLNRFEPETVEFLNAIGRTLFSDKPLADAFAEYSDWASQNMTQEQVADVMTDILDKRNDAVIANMLKALQRYETIIIPWGALHMPAIENAVLEQGFQPGAKKARMSLDFRAIPYRELLREWFSRTAADRAPPAAN